MSMARELEDGPENEVEDELAGAMMLAQQRAEVCEFGPCDGKVRYLQDNYKRKIR